MTSGRCFCFRSIKALKKVRDRSVRVTAALRGMKVGRGRFFGFCAVSLDFVLFGVDAKGEEGSACNESPVLSGPNSILDGPDMLLCRFLVEVVGEEKIGRGVKERKDVEPWKRESPGPE